MKKYCFLYSLLKKKKKKKKKKKFFKTLFKIHFFSFSTKFKNDHKFASMDSIFYVLSKYAKRNRIYVKTLYYHEKNKKMNLFHRF